MRGFFGLVLLLAAGACLPSDEDPLEAPAKIFRGAELYGHIDGGAEVFLDLGFDRLEVRKHHFSKGELGTEIYWMSDPVAALGIYLMKCGREHPAQGFEERNTANDYQLLFVKGKVFGIVNNLTEDAAAGPLLAELARKVAKTIPPDPAPDLFTGLPSKNRVPGSERVVRGGFTLEGIYTFGRGDVFLLDGRITALAADYEAGGEQPLSLVRADYPDEEAAATAFDHIAEHLDPYLEVQTRDATRLIFKDYAGAFGSVERDACRIDAWVHLKAFPEKDPYAGYLLHSKDFQPVRRDIKPWPGWYYMPWTYRWPIGYNEKSGSWCRSQGYNGAFLDHGRTGVNGEDKLAWIDRFDLPFYVDHLAGKGDLHLFDGGKAGPYMDQIHSTGLRTRPMNAAMAGRLKSLMKERIEAVKASPLRAAYALDDEPSWGYFVHPCMWQATDDRAAFDAWLFQVYGPKEAPAHEDWVTYDAIRPKLSKWSIQNFDCSALMDQWTFNDACFADLLGELVDYSNTLDPGTPCGIVGAQGPSPFGGFDYARLMRKIQFIEAYDLGGSRSIIRSFNPDNALPSMATHFHAPGAVEAKEDIRQLWYGLAHGDRGMIGWVENWFDAKTGDPLEWHHAFAPHCLEAGEKIGPLLAGAHWIHDGVALYYSHPSIQMGWILDAEAHGSTWRNRNEDHALGASHLVRRAWEQMLRDEGIQYDFLSYVDVAREGVPDAYKVLILPAVLCLSDIEIQRIEAFCEKGGTVIADYMPALFDAHGRGRGEGSGLDPLFGSRHDPSLEAGDVFQKRLWTEVDQEARYSAPTFHELLTEENTCLPGPGGFHKAVREMEGASKAFGEGRAVLMNLSPQLYLAMREYGAKSASARSVFMDPVKGAGPEPWVRLRGDGELFGYEITYWSKGDRTILFVCFNPQIRGEATGGNEARGVLDETRTIELAFSGPVKDLRNERTGEVLAGENRFQAEWRTIEALCISFSGPPPGR